MSQVKTITWTNPAAAVAKKLNVGFTVASITTVDETNGGSWSWNDQMADASVLDVDSGAMATSNGFTPLSESSNYGATISGFTNASPGVLTVDSTATAGFATGDTITVTGLADDITATSLNGEYVVASVTATTITTATNTTAYSVYVSGGTAIRVKDTNDDPIPTENYAIRGITVGTTPVGANDAVMSAVITGKENVA